MIQNVFEGCGFFGYDEGMIRKMVPRTLKEQVYQHLRNELKTKRLKPGETIPLDATAKKLGVSRTPLREACMQLQAEGFVTIVPRVGIYVNRLSLSDIRDYYQVIGSLEARAVQSGMDRITDTHLDRLETLNQKMRRAIEDGAFERFYRYNVAFHDVYIEPAENETLHQVVNNLKRRLYDFLPADRWIREWELESLDGHAALIRKLAERDTAAAVHLLGDITWSFDVHEPFIRQYYGFQPTDGHDRLRPNPYMPDQFA